MKVYLNRHLFDHRGEPVKEAPKGPDTTDEERGNERLGVMLVEGLLRDLPQDQGATGGMKMMRWKLAQKMSGFMDKNKDPEASMEVKSDDVAMIKGRLEKFVPTVLLGPTLMALEPEAEGEDEGGKVEAIR